jgi:hypothetical protein
MKRVILGICLILVLWCHSLSYAQDVRPIRVFGEVLYHRASIDGTVQQSDLDIEGTEIDLDATLGLEQTNGIIGKAGILIYGAHEFVVDYRRYKLSEDTELSATIRFGDIQIPSFVPISPSLSFQSVGLFYGYRLINSDYGFVSLRPGVEFVEYEVGVKADLFGLVQWESETYSGEYTVPFFWLAGEIYLHPMIALAGELSGGKIDQQMAYWGKGVVKFALTPNFAALAGYSQVWFKDDTEDNLFEVSLSGLVIGAQFVW